MGSGKSSSPLKTQPGGRYCSQTIVTNPFSNLYPQQTNQPPPCRIPRLTSIQVLQLHLSGSSHLHVQSYHFGWIFPSVKILQVQYYRWQCLPCKYDLNNAVPMKQQIKCYQRALAPWWVQCEQLRKVYGYIMVERQYVPIERPKQKPTTMMKFRKMLQQIL